MLIQDGNNRLEMIFVENTSDNAPAPGDLRFHMVVHFNSFSGDYGDVLVDSQEFRTFVIQLSNLERKRRGTAKLESMSPGEFTLEFHVLDAAGHVTAFGQLGSHCFGSHGGPYWCQIAFELDFCPSFLARYLAEFRAMIVDA